MTGIEVIINQILDEGKAQEKEILDSAEKMTAEIRRAAAAEAEKIRTDIEEKNSRNVAEYGEIAELSRQQKKNRALLGAKQEFIGRIIDKSYEKIMNMDGESYFELLKKTAVRHILPEEGVIVFNERDKNRMPEGFMAEIEAEAEKRGGKLRLSEDAGRFDGGFVLVYGGIEENCTLKAVFDAARDELHDKINEKVFG